jgi:hypothetical protein
MCEPPGPFDDIVRQLFELVFSWQHPYGGLPETFEGQPAGGWTSAELYAGVVLGDLEDLCPDGAIERLEGWLCTVCEAHGGCGIPHYPVQRDDGTTASQPVVEATAAFLSALTIRDHREDLQRGCVDWIGGAVHESGAWGIAPGEPERVYSTAYASAALAPFLDQVERVTRARMWLQEQRLEFQNGESGWSYRPGLTEVSPLMTVLAAQELREDDAEITPRVLATLKRVASATNCAEEDEFACSDGRKMTFTYAPRLTVIGWLLSRLADSDDRVDAKQILATLAATEHALRTTQRPVPEFDSVRAWHFIELAWGYGAIRRAFGRLSREERDWYADIAAALRADRLRRDVVARASAPLSRVCVRVWYESDVASDRLAGLLAATETLARLLRARMAAELMASGRHTRVEREIQRVKPGAGRTMWGLWDALSAGATQGDCTDFVRQIHAARPFLHTLIDFRNEFAHRAPPTPAGRTRLATDWDGALLSSLELLADLRDRPLVLLEEVGLPQGSASYLYRIRSSSGVGDQHGDEVVALGSRHADRLGEDVGRSDARLVYLGMPSGEGGAVPLLVSPFVVSLRCEGCARSHLFELEGAGRSDAVGAVRRELTFVSSVCGARLGLMWPTEPDHPLTPVEGA